ncbi:hypothetical protein [Methylobacterium oryzae]|uniref:hypothetical protein n=1 Tax=Methylobacterium oryzae TaxID=334852 RepID=UPI002F2C5DDB
MTLGEADEPVEVRPARDRVVVAPEQRNAQAARRDGIEGALNRVEARICRRDRGAPPSLALVQSLDQRDRARGTVEIDLVDRCTTCSRPAAISAKPRSGPACGR